MTGQAQGGYLNALLLAFLTKEMSVVFQGGYESFRGGHEEQRHGKPEYLFRWLFAFGIGMAAGVPSIPQASQLAHRQWPAGAYCRQGQGPVTRTSHREDPHGCRHHAVKAFKRPLRGL
jgi:hypothetical protein